jgi:hypothetical protein
MWATREKNKKLSRAKLPSRTSGQLAITTFWAMGGDGIIISFASPRIHFNHKPTITLYQHCHLASSIKHRQGGGGEN